MQTNNKQKIRRYSRMTALVGWMAVLASCVCFGSFGVPIKNPSVLRAQVHPLVFQSYKTMWVLLTSPIALLFVAEPQFTWWGVVSGAFWVPGGIAAVVSVTNVGLAVGQGTWSCLIVMVSFCWGAFFFKEPLRSLGTGIFAVSLLMCGLVGMTYFSVRPQSSNTSDSSDVEAGACLKSVNSSTRQKYSHVEEEEEERASSSDNDTSPQQSQSMISAAAISGSGALDSPRTITPLASPPFGLSRPTYGLIAAIFNGLWGGSSMVPLKLVSQAGYEGTKHVPIGVDFVISFAVGSAIINLVLWVILIATRYYTLLRYRHFQSKNQGDMNETKPPSPPPLPLLPPLHCQIMALPGVFYKRCACAVTHTRFFCSGCLYDPHCLSSLRVLTSFLTLKVSFACASGMWAGVLWAAGNFCSMVAVLNLGQAIGYSSVQASILVSGLWGMFYFKEIPIEQHGKWFGAAAMSTAGIILLMYDRA